MIKLCAIIPSYRHTAMIRDVIAALRHHDLPVFVIDDGNQDPYRAELASLSGEGVTVHHLSENRGKGAAVMEGFALAHVAGYTHALQIDADGQHDLAALSDLIVLAEKHPQALICAIPVYDKSIPLGRKIGRWITHVWVWIETLSFHIKDSMCGFRIYPLPPIIALMAHESIGKRMDFDTDIIVRLFWRGIEIISHPVRVIYPEGNISNFQMLADNWRISKMHTRLVFTGIWRLLKKSSMKRVILSEAKDLPPYAHEVVVGDPSLTLRMTEGRPTHWATMCERGSYLAMRFCAISYRLLGKRGFQIILAPIILYYTLIGKEQRWVSQQYLTRALGRPARFSDSYRHFWNFAMRMIDTFAAWNGRIKPGSIIASDPEKLAATAHDPRGALMIISHIGNTDLAPFMMEEKSRERLILLLHTKNSENYNRIIREFSKAAKLTIIEVTEIGPETIISLRERIENGAWISIAGDRLALTGGHSITVPFLGSPAPFAEGPWLLASLLECPVYLLFCLEKNGQHAVTMEYFAESVTLPRRDRRAAFTHYITLYAKRLEYYVGQAPYQWFNFFDFWTIPDADN